MQEELITEYIKNDGQMWTISHIDSYRDGGTIVLQTTFGKFNERSGNNELKYYIHHENWTLHNLYPPNNSNLITDKPTIAYIMYKIDKYQESIESKMRKIIQIKENLSIEGSRDRKINKILDK